jgi:hypothetical protein
MRKISSPPCAFMACSGTDLDLCATADIIETHANVKHMTNIREDNGHKLYMDNFSSCD